MVVRVPLGICETRFVCLETEYKSDKNGLLRYNGKSDRQNVFCTFMEIQVCVTVVGFGFTLRQKEQPVRIRSRKNVNR